MRKGWEIKKLGEVCNIYNGGTPDTTVSKFWNGENLWITPKDMGKMLDIYVDDTLRKITDEGLKNSSAKILPINSIILSSRAPIGHLAINRKPTATNQGCKGLVPKKDISTLYIFYFLSKSVELLNDLGSGTTFKEISGSKLGTVEIPIPPLPEQQRIVSILDEAFSSIEQAKENLQRNLQNAKELFQSEMNSIFTNKGEGWKEKKLSDLFSIKHGFAFKGEFFSDNGDYVLLTPGNFYEEGGYRDRGDKQKYYVGDIPNNYIIQKDDLLIAMTEQAAGLLGSPLIVPESDIFLHNQRLGLLIYNNGIKMDAKFLFHLFNTFRIRSLIHKSASGVKVRHTSPSKVLEISVNIPNLETQQKIVQQLDKLSVETKRLEAMYKQKLDALEELKKSILQKAFSGELSEN